MGHRRFLMPPVKWNCMTKNLIVAPSKWVFIHVQRWTTAAWITPLRSRPPAMLYEKYLNADNSPLLLAANTPYLHLLLPLYETIFQT